MGNSHGTTKVSYEILICNQIASCNLWVNWRTHTYSLSDDEAFLPLSKPYLYSKVKRIVVLVTISRM